MKRMLSASGKPPLCSPSLAASPAFSPVKRCEDACLCERLLGSGPMLLTQLTWRCSSACPVLCLGHPRRPFRLISGSCFHSGYYLTECWGKCPVSLLFPQTVLSPFPSLPEGCYSSRLPPVFLLSLTWLVCGQSSCCIFASL